MRVFIFIVNFLRKSKCEYNCVWRDLYATTPEDILTETIDMRSRWGCNRLEPRSVFTYFRMYQQYKCKDSYNNFLPVAEHNGVSTGIAASTSSTAYVSVSFRYKGVVSSTDECRITGGTIYAGSKSSSPSCAQTVSVGSYQSVSAGFNFGYGIHKYYMKLRAPGLFKVRNNIPCLTLVPQTARARQAAQRPSVSGLILAQ